MLIKVNQSSFYTRILTEIHIFVPYIISLFPCFLYLQSFIALIVSSPDPRTSVPPQALPHCILHCISITYRKDRTKPNRTINKTSKLVTYRKTRMVDSQDRHQAEGSETDNELKNTKQLHKQKNRDSDQQRGAKTKGVQTDLPLKIDLHSLFKTK